MADEKDVEKQKVPPSAATTAPEQAADQKAEKTDEKTFITRFLPWIIMAVTVVVCAGFGLGLGRLFAGTGKAETVETSQESEPAQAEYLKADDSATESQKSWYYDLEPVVANLDVPGVTRYVRTSITLEISPEVDAEKGTAFLKEKNPLLTNWLTIYLASLTLEDIRGDRNLKRIQSQILDAFNEKLFPDAKPQIKHILFKEFAIQ